MRLIAEGNLWLPIWAGRQLFLGAATFQLPPDFPTTSGGGGKAAVKEGTVHSVRFICSVVDMCLKLPTSELPPCSALSWQRARRDVTGSLYYFTSALLRSTTTGSKEGCYWKPRATWLLTAPAPPGMLSWVAVLLCFCLRITACITVLLYYSVAVLLYHCIAVLLWYCIAVLQ